MSLEIARLCGWKPTGTHRFESAQGSTGDLEDLRHLLAWQTEYICQDGQTVTAKDAIELADCLTRATVEGEAVLGDWNEGRFEPPATLRTPSTGFVWFATSAGKNHLQKLADFCRAGEFQIF